MKQVYIYPYKMGSKSAAALSEALDIYQIKHEKSRFKGSPRKTVINWGASKLSPEALKCKVINTPDKVSVAGDKLKFFQAISKYNKSMTDVGQKVNLVPWTDKKSEAQKWLDAKRTVVVRKLLNSHSGNGIIIVAPGEKLPDAPLYTQYIPKESEFRVHVVNGEVIDVQRKIRDPDREPTNWKVRSHDNGFIYVRSGFEVPNNLSEQAKSTILATGLTFGAVDLIVTKRGTVYVLECNCAPGIENSTVENYEKAFRRVLS